MVAVTVTTPKKGTLLCHAYFVKKVGKTFYVRMKSGNGFYSCPIGDVKLLDVKLIV